MLKNNMENKSSNIIDLSHNSSSDDELLENDMNEFMNKRKKKKKKVVHVVSDDDDDDDDDDSDSSDSDVDSIPMKKKAPSSNLIIIDSDEDDDDDDDDDDSSGDDVFENLQYNGAMAKKKPGRYTKPTQDGNEVSFSSDDEGSSPVFNRLKKKKTPTKKRKRNLTSDLQKLVDSGECTEESAWGMMQQNGWMSSRGNSDNNNNNTSKRSGNQYGKSKKKNGNTKGSKKKIAKKTNTAPAKRVKRKAAEKEKGSYRELEDDGFIVDSDEELEEEILSEEDFLSDRSTSGDEDEMSSIASLSDEDDDYDEDENKEEQEDIAAKKLVKECAASAQKIRESITKLMNERNAYRQSVDSRNNNNNFGSNGSSSNNSSSSSSSIATITTTTTTTTTNTATYMNYKKSLKSTSMWVNATEAHALFDYKLKLKDYQLTGLNWLIQLRANGINGILADEMGLGKTVQALAVIQFLHRMKQNRGPHLIIIPASTKDNWAREISRWTPGLNGKIYYGTQAERAEFRRREIKSDIDVMLCTYSIFERETNVEDRTYLKRFHFEYVICDEGHSLKNVDSARFKNINALNTNCRLILSGTPVQNNMRELLGLISFAMPKMFNNKSGRKKTELFVSYFERKYNNGKAKSADSVIKQVRTIIDPFILRRLKDEVLSEIPKKTEVTVKLDLEEDHKDAYNWTLKQIKLQKEGKIQITIAHLFSELRKAANHPILLQRLFNDKLDIISKISWERQIFGAECTQQAVKDYLKKDYNDYDINGLCLEFKDRNEILKSFCLNRSYILNSAKFKWLKSNLPPLINNGHRILLFSQWTSIMDVMEELLQELGYMYLRLDGQTNVQERQEIIDTFNAQGSIYKIFMLSTRAGGLGINLTSADTVILHDIDFNPQIDRQAVDRVHRIGQLKPVQVFRLICKGTVDEKILELADGKYVLDQSLLSDVKKSTPGKKRKGKRNGTASNKTMKQLLDEALVRGEL